MCEINEPSSVVHLQRGCCQNIYIHVYNLSLVRLRRGVYQQQSSGDTLCRGSESDYLETGR